MGKMEEKYKNAISKLSDSTHNLNQSRTGFGWRSSFFYLVCFSFHFHLVNGMYVDFIR